MGVMQTCRVDPIGTTNYLSRATHTYTWNSGEATCQHKRSMQTEVDWGPVDL
jgi:hypothetical protein